MFDEKNNWSWKKSWFQKYFINRNFFELISLNLCTILGIPGPNLKVLPSTRKRKTWFVEKKSPRDSGIHFLQKRFASSSATINASFLTRLWRQGFNAYGHLNVSIIESLWTILSDVRSHSTIIHLHFHFHGMQFEDHLSIIPPPSSIWELSRCTKSVTECNLRTVCPLSHYPVLRVVALHKKRYGPVEPGWALRYGLP